MGDSFVNTYKQILDASYDIYGDINGINTALFKAATTLGLKSVPIPTLAVQLQKQPPIEETMKIPLPTPAKSIPENVPSSAASGKNAGGNEKVESIPISTAIEAPIEMQTQHVLEQKAQPKPLAPPPKPLGKTPAAEIDITRLAPKFSAIPQEKQTIARQEAEIKRLEQDKLSTETAMPLNLTEIQPVQISQAEVSDGGVSDNPVSNLLKLVKSKGSITISDAARLLGVRRDLVEQWSRILNKNSLLRLKYQLVGDTVMEA